MNIARKARTESYNYIRETEAEEDQESSLLVEREIENTMPETSPANLDRVASSSSSSSSSDRASVKIEEIEDGGGGGGGSSVVNGSQEAESLPETTAASIVENALAESSGN